MQRKVSLHPASASTRDRGRRGKSKYERKESQDEWEVPDPIQGLVSDKV